MPSDDSSDFPQCPVQINSSSEVLSSASGGRNAEPPFALILLWPVQCPAAPGAAGVFQRVLPALWLVLGRSLIEEFLPD